MTKAKEYALGMMGYPDLTKLEHYGDKQMCATIERSYERGHSDALIEVITLINHYHSGMSEYFMQHNHRELFGLWEKYKSEIENKKNDQRTDTRQAQDIPWSR